MYQFVYLLHSIAYSNELMFFQRYLKAPKYCYKVVLAVMWNSLSICLLILSTSAYGTSRQNTINYTVENVISNDDREFQETQVLEPADRVFIDIMDEAAANDETFRYESIDYGEPLGEYVYEINGLGESRPDQTFWALLERTDSGDCFVPTGVSYYVPETGTHVVFAYLTYSMSGELPSC